jgi:hypothetical protein
MANDTSSAVPEQAVLFAAAYVIRRGMPGASTLEHALIVSQTPYHQLNCKRFIGLSLLSAMKETMDKTKFPFQICPRLKAYGVEKAIREISDMVYTEYVPDYIRDTKWPLAVLDEVMTAMNEATKCGKLF